MVHSSFDALCITLDILSSVSVDSDVVDSKILVDNAMQLQAGTALTDERGLYILSFDKTECLLSEGCTLQTGCC